LPGIVVDIGTGDGEFVYQLAKQNPDRFIIGIDPHRQGLERVSSRTSKKPTKGGLKNALFVLGSIKDLPDELEGIANQVFINLPWGALLKTIVLVEDATWTAIKRLCVRGAFLDILISYGRESEGTEFSKLDMPTIDLSYLKGITVPKIEQKGFRLVSVENVEPDELKDYPSSWAKRLSYGRDREYYYLRVESI
jgi:16S rRNA (adenine(1408)-N(1))-methyltransferase